MVSKVADYWVVMSFAEGGMSFAEVGMPFAEVGMSIAEEGMKKVVAVEALAIVVFEKTVANTVWGKVAEHIKGLAVDQLNVVERR